MRQLDADVGVPVLRDDLRRQVGEGLDPERKEKEGAASYPEYADDPVGFAYDVLHIDYLTSDQETFLEAVATYERVVALSATGTGKTFALSLLALWFFFCRKKPLVYTFAAPPEGNLRDLLWGEIYTRVHEREALFEELAVRADMSIVRAPKIMIKGVTIPRSATDEDIVSSFSGKHAPSLMFIGDEADAVPDPVFEGVDGCLSGGFPRLVLCLNPKKKSGYVHEELEKGRAHAVHMSAFNHPNVVQGRDVVPGAVTREKTIERIHEWCEPLPPGEPVDEWCFELPEFLVGERAVGGAGVPYPPLKAGTYRAHDHQFFTKVLGKYPPVDQSRLIYQTWIDQAVSKWESLRTMNGGAVRPPGGIQPDMSMDVAGGGPNNNVVWYRYGDWFDVPDVWSGVDSARAAEQAAYRYVRRNSKLALVDASGVGNGVAPRMARMVDDEEVKQIARQEGITVNYINAVGIDTGEAAKQWNEEGKFYKLRDQGFWNLRLAFKEGNIMIPPADYNQACKRLHRALKKLTYTIENSEIRVIKKKKLISLLGGDSPDEADGLMLHFVGARTWMGGV